MRQIDFRFMDDNRTCRGYEIHMGRTVTAHPFITFPDGTREGCMVDGKCFGSYVHGILDNPAVIDFILSPFEDRGDTVDFDAESFKNEQYDLLAQWLRQYIDIPELYKIMGRND